MTQAEWASVIEVLDAVAVLHLDSTLQRFRFRTVAQLRNYVLRKIDDLPDALLMAWHEHLRDRIDDRIRRTRDEHRGEDAA